jgi:hypothetical protein
MLSKLPLLLVLASFAYAAVYGRKAYILAGSISILGIAATLAGLTAGWLLERFRPLAHSIDAGIDNRDSRLGILLLFSLIAALAFLAVTCAKRDASGQSRLDSDLRKCGLLTLVFVVAVGIPAHGTIAAYLVALLGKIGL